MSKVNLKVKLITNEENLNFNISGIINNNVIIYKDDNICTKLDLNNNILVRYNDEYEIILDFNKRKYEYNLKEYNKKIDGNLKVKGLIKNSDYFNVSYNIESNSINYEIYFEVV